MHFFVKKNIKLIDDFIGLLPEGCLMGRNDRIRESSFPGKGLLGLGSGRRLRDILFYMLFQQYEARSDNFPAAQ